jgi:hypothetical protein
MSYWRITIVSAISILISIQGYRARWYRRQLLGMRPLDRRSILDRRVGFDRRKGIERRRNQELIHDQKRDSEQPN